MGVVVSDGFSGGARPSLPKAPGKPRPRGPSGGLGTTRVGPPTGWWVDRHLWRRLGMDGDARESLWGCRQRVVGCGVGGKRCGRHFLIPSRAGRLPRRATLRKAEWRRAGRARPSGPSLLSLSRSLSQRDLLQSLSRSPQPAQNWTLGEGMRAALGGGDGYQALLHPQMPPRPSLQSGDKERYFYPTSPPLPPS